MSQAVAQLRPLAGKVGRGLGLGFKGQVVGRSPPVCVYDVVPARGTGCPKE